MVNTITAVLVSQENERKHADISEQYLGEARDSIYKAFVVTYQDRLLRAILKAKSTPTKEVVFDTIDTVGFLFKHRSFGQIILPVGAPDRSTYVVHQNNLSRVEQALKGN